MTQMTDKTAPRVTIIHHPDVRRALMTQKAYAEGLRALYLYTAAHQDPAVAADRVGRRRRAGRPGQRSAAADRQGRRLRAGLPVPDRVAADVRRIGVPAGLPDRAVHPRRQDRLPVRGHDRDSGAGLLLPQDRPRPGRGAAARRRRRSRRSWTTTTAQARTGRRPRAAGHGARRRAGDGGHDDRLSDGRPGERPRAVPAGPGVGGVPARGRRPADRLAAARHAEIALTALDGDAVGARPRVLRGQGRRGEFLREECVAAVDRRTQDRRGCGPDDHGSTRGSILMKVITSIDDAVASVGEELGVSEWQEIDQDRINAFADATGDHQWIHIDAERAKTESPYGTTIAHGFLTLSMIPALTKDNYRVENAKMAINYGSDKVRFIAAVPSGGRIRARSELIDATKVDDNTVNLKVKNTIELDGSKKPAAVAETIVAGAVLGGDVDPSACGTSIGTISSTNARGSMTLTARWWLRTAQASWSSRVRPYSTAQLCAYGDRQVERA